MSTANSNLDNDPFPVFTPRSLQQQIGRSPIQQTQLNTNNVSSPNGMLIQSSPYTNQSGTSRFNNNNNNTNNNTNMMNLMRSPSNSISSNLRQLQQQQMHNDNVYNRQLIANMVQNLSLNQNTNTNNLTQTPMLNKHHTPSSTPPPPISSSTSSLQSQSILTSSSASQLSQTNSNSAPQSSSNTSAHRKLFSTIDNSHHVLNNNDINLLNGQIDTGLHHHLHHLPSVVSRGGGPNTLQPPSQQQQQQPAMSGDGLNEPSRQAPPDLSNIVHLKRSESYFMSDELRSELIRKNLLTLAVPTQELAIQLPAQVKDYHNLVPLDNQQINIDHKSRTFGYQTISYKATHIKTNCVYYLKRIIGFRYVNQRCIDIVEAWKKLQHGNICTLRDVFGTKEFNGDHSIVFVYDYYPGLETLQYRLYNNPNINLKGWANPYNLDGTARPFSAGKTIINGSRSLGLLPEQSVWDYVIQLTSIIRSIHSMNFACRIISPSRLLVDHKSRLRLSGVGIFDVIDCENSLNAVAQYQQEDLIEFGKLVLALACNSLIAIQKEHINTSVEIISRNYSADLRNLILHFMTPSSNMNGRVKSINDSMPTIGARFYTSLDNAYTRGDIIENDLSKEIENGRLFRLISKLNIVLDRQDMSGDLQWTETGDRYMLKLFRDYVFHQVTPNGQPWIDLSHIVQCLNKFDTGSNDKICLVSPDGQNIMIVSYAQLKKCFEKVFNEILAMMNT